MVRDIDGSLRQIRPTDTLWYLLYVATPPSSKRLEKQFRQRFRLPYGSFVNLASDISENVLFNRWTRKDAAGSSPSDIRLLVLGVLRFLGRAWTLDDISEANGISIHTNNVFLKCFIKYGSTTLYEKWVLNHIRNDNISEQESIYRMAGFNGCI